MFKETCLLILLAFASLAFGKQLTTNEGFPLEPKEWEGPKVAVKPSSFSFYVDDQIWQFYVNDNLLPLQFTDLASKFWNKLKTMNLNLFSGDIIKMVVSDTDGGLGMVGTLKFYNAKGEEKIYHTGEGWYCNGKPVDITSANEKVKKDYPEIDGTANWIWDKKAPLKTNVTCVFKIPCSN